MPFKSFFYLFLPFHLFEKVEKIIICYLFAIVHNNIRERKNALTKNREGKKSKFRKGGE